MSEEQERTPETEQAEILPETVQAEPAEGEMVSISEDDATEEPVLEEQAPPEDRVFGMPRPCFHGGALGIGLGYIAAGFLSNLLNRNISPMTLAIVFAVIGYLITKRMYNKKKAENQVK